MNDTPATAPFPTKGLDVSHAHGVQPPGTTPVGTNVRVCEPSTLRLRGGSRPGLGKYVAGQVPVGSELVQELNTVIIADAAAIDGGIDDPGTDLVDDPSSDGPSPSWGTATIYLDPYTGDPVTGADEGSRNPYDGTGQRSKRRKKGGGYQPNKNTVSPARAPIDPEHHCFQGQIQIQITKPAPDPFGFTGQQPAFTGTLCAPYVAGNPVFVGPSTAEVMKVAAGSSQTGSVTLLPDDIAYWLWNTVGHDSFGTIISDLVGLPSAGTCSGSGTCSGASPPSVPGTAVGAIINARAPGT
jgi:hypothetical protein